ncbi:hypothetical protein LEM8419_00747 [Neolewinella maritima]|uniref:DUF3298 domain-containing protein n=1 Tax=Neolewinella maritima TaxID=1383882 RepID=A0ABM9AXK9_9BACT|nr:RsiV family protein [Neolewinella maritima]CAH0999447.1 hypothetical protein LEM8419_00747 [Neolewinella maritima]
MHLRIALFLLLCYGCQTPDPAAAPTTQPPAPLTFTPLAYADSASLLGDSMPYRRMYVETLVASGGDPVLRDTLNALITRQLLDRMPSPDSTLEELLHTSVQQSLTAYTSQEVDAQAVRESPYQYVHMDDHRTVVEYQSDSLYVLAHNHAFYSGGAHGMYYTVLLTVATDPVRHLRLTDVFKPGTEAALSKLLTARTKAPGVAYTTFEDTIPATENFALLPDGMRFLYPPYEIGPYAAGEIAIELPYDELRPLLRTSMLPLIDRFR